MPLQSFTYLDDSYVEKIIIRAYRGILERKKNEKTYKIQRKI